MYYNNKQFDGEAVGSRSVHGPTNIYSLTSGRGTSRFPVICRHYCRARFRGRGACSGRAAWMDGAQLYSERVVTATSEGELGDSLLVLGGVYSNAYVLEMIT